MSPTAIGVPEQGPPAPPKVIEKPWGRIIQYADGSEVPIVKDRYEWVNDPDFSLASDTLVGSHFHVVLDGKIIWQGAIIGEPRAGDYLVHIDKLEDGATDIQRIFSIDTLQGLGEEGRRLIEHAMAQASAPVVNPSLEWRFFDSKKKAQLAWVKYLERQPRQREEQS